VFIKEKLPFEPLISTPEVHPGPPAPIFILELELFVNVNDPVVNPPAPPPPAPPPPPPATTI
jgi:hypothetical protein